MATSDDPVLTMHRVGVELRQLSPNNQRSDAATTARLIDELKRAFRAVAGYGLSAYRPAGEQPDGWDLILEDADGLVPLLLRTSAPCSVRRYLLNPNWRDRELFGFGTDTVCGAGRAGGVLLVSKAADGLLTFRYSDVEIMTLLSHKVIALPNRSAGSLKRLRDAMMREHIGVVRLPACAFVTPRSPECLIDLVGLERGRSNGWREGLRALLEAERARTSVSRQSATSAKRQERVETRSKLRANLTKRVAELVIEPVPPVLSPVSDRP